MPSFVLKMQSMVLQVNILISFVDKEQSVYKVQTHLCNKLSPCKILFSLLPEKNSTELYFMYRFITKLCMYDFLQQNLVRTSYKKQMNFQNKQHMGRMGKRLYNKRIHTLM